MRKAPPERIRPGSSSRSDSCSDRGRLTYPGGAPTPPPFPTLPPHMLPSPRIRWHLSGDLADLRALLAIYGDIPLRVLARDLATDSARDDALALLLTRR